MTGTSVLELSPLVPVVTTGPVSAGVVKAPLDSVPDVVMIGIENCGGPTGKFEPVARSLVSPPWSALGILVSSPLPEKIEKIGKQNIDTN